jgi:NAD(P)-dependent dehydrogenase (short-subunit alcohol dehydrogenase family)
VVTGASSGAGRGLRHGLAEAGADLALGARLRRPLADTVKLVAAAGPAGDRGATDVSLPARLPGPGRRGHGEFGRVDILVNNAGIGTAVPATRETAEQFGRSSRQPERLLLDGQACARVMGRGSSIINISSILGSRPRPAAGGRTRPARPA